MPKVKEKDAVDSLIKILSKFLNSTGERQEDLAKDIEDFASFDLMEYNDRYEDFSEEMKHIMDSLFIFHKWKGRGIYYGKELFFGTKDTRDLVERLKKLKRVL
ncbi:MAG: hypothetical protein ISS93_02900 [Candidatus Aenigmarchaeota archaeon]|nr:hypothetical protein [Candidatus Aenigmarchaeota archaeon]